MEKYCVLITFKKRYPYQFFGPRKYDICVPFTPLKLQLSQTSYRVLEKASRPRILSSLFVAELSYGSIILDTSRKQKEKKRKKKRKKIAKLKEPETRTEAGHAHVCTTC